MFLAERLSEYENPTLELLHRPQKRLTRAGPGQVIPDMPSMRSWVGLRKTIQQKERHSES